MRKLALGLGLLAALAAPVSAQVSVQLVLQQDQFLPGEALPVAVRITNRSGQTLHLGKESDWLSFSVESRDRTAELKLGDVPVTGEFTLESSQVATKRVDLAPYYALGYQGRYSVVATIRIKGWDRQVSSPAKSFYIIDGAKLWEQMFGVPALPGGTNALPEARRYLLQEANYLQGELRLYLRITDGSGSRTLRVVPIGPMVSVSHPEPLLDRLSNLHLLYQNGARAFSYTVHSPDGGLLVRQTYDYFDVRPRLRMDENGAISVYGGVRRETPRDVPAPTNDVPAMLDPPPDLKPVEPPRSEK